MQELQTTYTPAQITTNLDDIERGLARNLEKFNNLIVTADTVPENRRVAAELNKSKQLIATERKALTKRHNDFLGPITERMKKLEAMHDEPLNALKQQIARFEEDRKNLAREYMTIALVEHWEELGVEPYYQMASIEDLVKLGALTNTNKLTKSTATEIRNRAEKDAAWQREIEARLAELELESRRAGLAVPLNRGHVDSFLEAPLTEYREKLARVIQSELDREQALREIEQRKREEAEAAILAEEQADQETPPAQEPEPEPQAAPATQDGFGDFEEPTTNGFGDFEEPTTNGFGDFEEPAGNGFGDFEEPTTQPPAFGANACVKPASETVTVTCEFTLELPIGRYSDDELKQTLLAQMKERGFTSVSRITVNRNINPKAA